MKKFLSTIAFCLMAILVQAQAGCPYVSANSQTLPCGTTCTNLTANYFNVGSTNTYEVNQIAYAPPFTYSSGTPILINTDDIWSSVLNLPFNFCFFGQSYSSLIIGSNGIISFNTAYAGSGNTWAISGPVPANTPADCQNSIMGVWEDIDPTILGTTQYEIGGSYPCRYFKVSWDSVPYYGDPNSVCGACYTNTPLWASTEIVLYETTNVIEIFIRQKQCLPPWNGGLAVEGIVNANSTAAYTVPGRNATQWVANNDAWRFTPTSSSIVNVVWSQGGNVLSTSAGDTVVGNQTLTYNVCPPNNDSVAVTTGYTVTAVYNRCDGTTVVESDSINVTTTPSPNAGPDQTPGCYVPGITATMAAHAFAGAAWTAVPGNPSSTAFSNGSSPTTTITGFTMAGTYKYTWGSGACHDTAQVIITTIANAGPDQLVSCVMLPGGTATMAANPGGTWTALPGNPGMATITSPTSPNTTITDFTDTGVYAFRWGNGTCADTALVTVTSPSPVSVNPASVTICNGQNAMLTASGGASYHWSNASMTDTATFSPAVTTTYDVTVTEANGCTASASGIVNVNPLPLAAITPNPTQICAGDSATLTGGGGISYTWSDSATTTSITISPAISTTYIVTVTDANSCSATASSTVTVNPLSVPVINPPTPQICIGNSTTLTASGGSSYLWNNGINTAANTVNPVVTTTYTVTVTDIHSCSASASETVTVNPLPLPAVTPPLATICAGNSSILTATGGVSYIWSNGANTAPDTVSPLTATTYTVTVTDANSCTATASGTVNVNALPTPTIAPPAATICFGNSATLTAGGGLGYHWSNGPNTASNTVSPASTTTYTVTVTDVNSCSASVSGTVTVNPLPIPLIAPPSPQICIGNSAIMLASGGSSYMWSNSISTASDTVSPLVTTTYTVTVTDTNNCSATGSATVTVNPLPTPMVIPALVTICHGNSTTLTATGGVGFVWSNGINTASDTVSPATAANYTVTVTDANSCSATASGTVNVNPVPSPVITPSLAICDGNTASLTAGGGISYLWSNGTNMANTIVSPNISTIYTVTVTNTFNCTALAFDTVTVHPLPNVTINPNPAQICIGSMITLTAGGGTSYIWNTAATTNAITVFPAVNTNYSVTATDANNCTAASAITVTVNPLPVPTALPASVAICLGDSTLLTAGGGTSYQWSNGAGTAINTVSPAAYQIYIVTVTDANNCSATASDTVIVHPLPTVQISPATSDICLGLSATLTESGSGISYVWNTGAVSASITVSPGTTTTYTVQVTDINSCVNSASATVNVVQPMTLTPVVSQISCYGAHDGSIDLQVSGGQPLYNFAWNNAATTQTISQLDIGTYSVTVTDNAGCTAASTTIITQPAILALSGTPYNPLCTTFGNDGSIALDLTGGTTPYQFLWSNNMTSQNLLSVGPGTYSVQVTDADNCTISDTFTLAYVYNFSVQATPAVWITMGGDTMIGYTVSGASGTFSAVWTPASDLSCTGCSSPVASPQTTTTYQIEIINDSGCIAKDTVTVFVIPDHAIYIPNSFTPNGDGINDLWQAFGHKNTWILCEVAVYDRWGEKVFASSDLNFQWDGRYRGELVPPGEYIYSFKLVFEDDFTITNKGGITVIR